jgi:hypothetical protein
MSMTRDLFVPELCLGIEELDAADRVRLQRYLHTVIEERGFPLHTSVAWNALHFGFDPLTRSYDQSLLDADMRTIGISSRAAALPVGALCWVDLRGTRHEVWAEIVGKDGRPRGVDEDGSADPDLAGRPADSETTDDGREVAVVREALVFDYEAFGPLPDLSSALNRLERRGRLGRHKLVEVDAVYDPPEAASDSDTWFYARWLFDTQRHLLFSGPLGVGLHDPSDDALRAALVASLNTVDFLLSSIPGVVRWGDYALLEDWVREIDWSPNLPLHRYDLEYLVTSMAAAGRDPVQATATALVPRLERFAASVVAPAERPDAVLEDPLDGFGYLRVVARTSRWLADYVDDHRSVIGARGQTRLLRVDDTWPWGGLWRSEPWGPGHPLTGVPADEPLWIGSRGWGPLAEYLEIPLAEIEASVERALRAPEEESGPPREEGPGEEEVGEEGEQQEERPDDDLVSSVVEGHATLRQVDVDSGTLPVPEHFSWLCDTNPVKVVLSHEGEIDPDQRSQTAKSVQSQRLQGLDWPPDFFGGIRLHLSAITGGRVLFAATLALDDTDSGYMFGFDPSVVGRPSPGTELTLAAVAVAALHRHGRTATDDTRRATAKEIGAFCFGPDAPLPLVAALASALDAVVAAGRLKTAGSEYVWSPSSRPPPRRCAPTGWTTTRVSREAVRRHFVPGFLRRLHPGWHASAAQLALYTEHRAQRLISGPAVLPPGVTYVPGHQRGKRDSVIGDMLRQVVSDAEERPPEPEELEDLLEEWGR